VFSPLPADRFTCSAIPMSMLNLTVGGTRQSAVKEAQSFFEQQQ
jgi:hypothetical protein